MTLKETLDRVLPLARAIQTYWDAELPKRHPRYPMIEPGASDGPPPVQSDQLRALLQRLPKEALARLSVVDKVGRAGLDPGDAEQELRDDLEYLAPEHMVNVLMRRYSLANEIEYGLERLRARKIDIDQFDLQHAGA